MLHPWTDFRSKAAKAKILMVGAGGIGCELIKNLVLAGFHNIHVIDLDTIDVTNLNRQFLFHKQHVGKPKAIVAKESVLQFNPDANIVAIHDSIMKNDYGVSFFKQFDLVMNALDNRAARSHVNRMCLAADIPLVESGTAGYLGQVTVIRKGSTECYDCQPKPHQKTFPGCTIRNTPSEPIHCIVWSKHLFNQLFGETDPDEDVSPDAEDPELQDAAEGAEGDNGEKKDNNGKEGNGSKAREDGNVNRISTRQWAVDCDYDAAALFHKFFFEDIKYLLSMDKLWSKRTPPIPLEWNEFPKEDLGTISELRDQAMWSLAECAHVFEKSINDLKQKIKALPANDHLVWDKDDDSAMDFVTACANIRAHIFHIARKSRFDVKSMAGNIIPAIATTNAIIAGAIVMEGIKLIMNDEKSCRAIYLTRKPNPRKKVLVPCHLDKPNPKCYVCARKPEVSVKLNLNKTTIHALQEKFLKGTLNFVAPDVEVEGKGIILISSEEGETDTNNDKTLDSFNLADGAILMCDDYLQNYTLRVILYHSDHHDEGKEFELLSDVSELNPSSSNGAESSEKDSKKPEAKEESDDDICEIIEEEKEAAAEQQPIDMSSRKRKIADEPTAEELKKKKKLESEEVTSEEVICID